MLYFGLILIAIVIGDSIKKNYTKRGFVGAYIGVSVGMLVYYAIIPLTMFLFQKGYYDNSNYYGFKSVIIQIINRDSLSIYRAITYVMIGFISFYFSYYVRITIRSKNNNSRVTINIQEETLEYYALIAKILFIISLPCLLFYIMGFGGITRALAVAESMRSFNTTVATYINPVIALCKIPACFITVDSYLWLYLSQKRPSSINKLLLWVSSLASIIYFLIDAGRMRLLLYIFTFFFMFFRKRIKHIWIWILSLIIPSLGIIDFLSELFVYFQTGNFQRFEFNSVGYLNVIREFSYPFRSLLHLPEIIEKNEYLYFKNIVLDILSLLPGVQSDKSYYLVSEFFGGYNWRLYGGVPNDALTYGYINLGVLGIIILMWVVGKICYYCDQYLWSLASDDTKVFWGIVLAGSLFNWVASADWNTVLHNNVSLTIPVIIMIIDKKRRIIESE